MSKKNPLKILFYISITIAIFWVASLIFSILLFNDWTIRGTFGDSFGAINSLFSGLAFGGIIYTILLQRTELKLQREELKLTRKELKRSADGQEATTQLMGEQLRINNMPLFNLKAVDKNGYTTIKISNNSIHTAFDVEIIVYLKMSQELDNIYNRIEPKPNNIDLNEYIEDNKYWYFEDSGFYQMFDGKNGIEIPLDYPVTEYKEVIVFIQYYDTFQNNYAFFFELKLLPNETPPLELNSVYPMTPKVLPRLEMVKGAYKLPNSTESPKFYDNIMFLDDMAFMSDDIVNYKNSQRDNRWDLINIS